MALSPVEGYNYLAVKFAIKNESSETKYLNTFDMELRGLIMVNGIYFDYEIFTLFPNDICFIGDESEDPRGEPVRPGTRYNDPNGAVMVFRVPENIDIDTAGLLITNKYNDSVIIKIQ